MAEEKLEQIDYIVSQVKENDHFVVYCGDGKLFDKNTGEELRHIQSVKRVLSAHGYKPSQFTAQENIDDRMQLVDAFNKGEIYIPEEIKEKSIGVDGNLTVALKEIRKGRID